MPKQGALLTDGTRIYFNEGAVASWKIAQVATTGGPTSILPIRLGDAELIALSRQGSTMLAFDNDPFLPNHLWKIPLPAGDPRRLGSIEAQYADFLPDGRILFYQGDDLFTADGDGSGVRKLLSIPDGLHGAAVSPDGQRIIVTNYSQSNRSYSLVELRSDGSNLRTILKSNDDRLCCPRWAANGKFVVFRRSSNFVDEDLWVLPAEGGGLFHRSERPIQLTNGPLSYTSFVPSPDGKHIYALGRIRRGELVRYDMRSNQFAPFLSGISAIDPTFSTDGRWVAYTSYPDHTLWRSRTDGTDRLQLTYPPTQVSYPFISPDGKQVSFTTRDGIYLVAMDGGTPRRIADNNSFIATWSPDGNYLAYNLSIDDKTAKEGAVYELRTFDVRNSTVSVVPLSRGITDAQWVTHDTLIAAKDADTIQQVMLILFDLKTGKWTKLVSGDLVNWALSADRKHLYYTIGGDEPKAMRIRFSDHKIEEITSLKALRRVSDPVDNNTQITVAPDGSPVFTRDIGTQEIYALTVKWP
jgi:Tol biopolymer transport system component